MEFERVIAKGTIFDGTGAPRYLADLGLHHGRIEAIARPGTLTGGDVLSAEGLGVAPGFIDIHSHTDWTLPLSDHQAVLAPMVAQGITTVVAGNCGFSPAPISDLSAKLMDGFSEVMRDSPFPYRWRTMAEFLDTLERDGLLMNAAFLVGHGTARYAAMGRRPSAPTQSELTTMCSIVRQAIRDGAFGMSAGLAYDPGVFAKNDELFALLRTVADEGAVYTVHGRAYVWISPFYQPMFLGPPHNVRSTREQLKLSRESRVRVQLSHQIFIGRRTWPTYRWVLRDIERARAEGVDVAFDAFPYTAGNSTINAIFPEWVLDHFAQRIRDPRVLQRLRREFAMFRLLLGLEYGDIQLLSGGSPELHALEGLDFSAIARLLGMSEFDAYVHVARVSNGKARVLLGTYSGDADREEPLRAVLAHPLCAFETDSILTRHGRHNPASFGTFPRVLGRYSRELGLFGMEEAVRRMTSLPAERIGLSEVGRIAPGRFADLVLFDPATVADNTTCERADAAPSGIQAVLISGKVVAKDGLVASEARHGRVLRR